MILFCGDNHGIFDHIISAVLTYQPAAVILLGDLQSQKPLEVELASILDRTEVWFVHGNHDTDSDADYDNLFGSTLADRNLHGRVIEIAGARIAGLGGVFRGQIWMPPALPNFDSQTEYVAKCGMGNRWRGGLSRKHRSSIFPIDYLGLNGQRADILVTHEAPSCHPHGFESIDQLARSLGAIKTFHGHQHDRLDYSNDHDRLGFDAFGVGFCGISNESGTVILPGKFDEASGSDK